VDPTAMLSNRRDQLCRAPARTRLVAGLGQGAPSKRLRAYVPAREVMMHFICRM
jgi:hypothetical protein